MKSTNDLIGEMRARSRARLDERKEILTTSISVRREAERANEEIGQETMAKVTIEALSTAELSIHKVDSVIERLENLRLQVIQIAIGERWHQTERTPQIDDLARDLGELAALLEVRRMLAPKDAR